MTKDVKGLMSALRQFINEALLESDDVAAAMEALKRTGRCPVFTIDIALEDAPQALASTEEASGLTGELVLTGSDMELLRSLGIAVSGTNKASTA